MHTQTILCIEDDPRLREFLIASLEQVTSLGTVILDAADGATGLRLARDRMPQLVILDLGLPDMPGVEVARQLHELPLPPKVLVYTSAMPATVLAQLKPGLVHGFLSKSSAEQNSLRWSVRSLLAGQNLLTA